MLLVSIWIQKGAYPQKFSLFTCLHGGHAIGFALRMKFFSFVEISSLYGHFVGEGRGAEVDTNMGKKWRRAWSEVSVSFGQVIAIL